MRITKDRIEQEMAWLRCINFDNQKDVRRAAIEIIKAVENEDYVKVGKADWELIKLMIHRTEDKRGC
ncbi:MAG: hypothetical protein ACYDFR_03275 [Candidatus Omnitrophota bacterium]